jgi:hypothetical protein
MSGRHAVTRTGSRSLVTRASPPSHLPTASMKSSSSGLGSWQSRSTLCPACASAAHRRAL